MAAISNASSKFVLEVERKFCGLTTTRLRADSGSPNFRSLRNLGWQAFRDIYFDRDSRLCSRGVYVRKRHIVGGTARWEAKCCQGGTHINSMFEELTDEGAIADCVEQLTGHPGSPKDDFGLQVMADIATTRQSWLADARFKIVLDSTDFGHEVGEVELEFQTTPPTDQLHSASAWKRRLTQDMDAEVAAFMSHYHWAFRPGIPRSKLTAYLERPR